MRVNGILSFLSFCDVCSDDCRSAATSTTASALFHPAEKNSINL